MKPIKLTIAGLKSFNEKVTVDFNQLLKRGMFGIFGDTGSGKSTLLDGIIYALYANFDKEHINKRTNKTYINFVFEISYEGVRRTYEVERTFFVEKPSQSYLYEITFDGKFCIAEKTKDVNDKILQIIGLKSSEFEQCIVLPQGKFDKFLSSGRSERISIIENLFGLEKYGVNLKSKLDSERFKIKTEFDVLSDRLNNLSEYTSDGLLDVQNQLNELDKTLKTTNEKISKNQEYISKNESFYNDKLRVDFLNKELNNCAELRMYYEGAQKVFNDIDKIKYIVDLSNEVDDLNNQIYQKSNEREKLLLTLVIKEKNFVDITKNKEVDLPKLKEFQNEFKVKIEKLNLLSELYSEYLNDVKKINELKIEFENNEKQLVKLNTKLAELNEEIQNLTTKKDSLNSTEIFNEVINLVSSDSNGVLLNEELKFLESLKSFSEFENTNQIKSAVLERISVIVEKITLFGGKVEVDVLSSIKDAESKLSEIDALSNKIQKLSNDVSLLQSQISTISTSNAHIKEQGAQIKERALNSKAKITNETNGEDLQTHKNWLISRLDKTNEKIQFIENKYEEMREDLFEFKSKITSLEGVINTLIERYKISKIKLQNSFFGEYKEIGDVKYIYNKYGKNTQLKKQVEEYFTIVNSYKTERDEKEKNLVAVQFNLDEFIKIKQNNDELLKNLLEISENFGKLQNSCKNYEQNFKNKCIIEDNLKEVIYKQNIIDKLYKVVDKRKLLEFIADEYLKEITKLARKTVTTLSSGKYGLEYKGEFLVVDNLNGGVVRPVSTLSGGETFIISLSLALALSQEIFAKSMRPIEFFFLDEGFGTLDRALTETVVESLNKLKNSNFSIGLISHVPELIDAVDAKIFVKSQTFEHGSQISYQLT